MKTNAQLREIIRATLDCQTHFKKPTIINNDDAFEFGRDPIVACAHCVQRLREAIGLKDGEQAPSSYRFNVKENHKIRPFVPSHGESKPQVLTDKQDKLLAFMEENSSTILEALGDTSASYYSNGLTQRAHAFKNLQNELLSILQGDTK